MRYRTVIMLWWLVLSWAVTAYPAQPGPSSPNLELRRMIGGLKESQDALRQQVSDLNTELGKRMEEASASLGKRIEEGNATLNKHMDETNALLNVLTAMIKENHKTDAKPGGTILAFGTLATGSLAGAILTVRAMRRGQRVERSLKVLDQYLSMYPELAEAQEFLLTSTSPPVDARQLNAFVKVGTWYNLIASYWEEGKLLDTRLLRKQGIDGAIRSFYKLVQRKAETTPELENYLQFWPRLGES
jgi:hypothetical protein